MKTCKPLIVRIVRLPEHREIVVKVSTMRGGDEFRAGRVAGVGAARQLPRLRSIVSACASSVTRQIEAADRRRR